MKLKDVSGTQRIQNRNSSILMMALTLLMHFLSMPKEKKAEFLRKDKKN